MEDIAGDLLPVLQALMPGFLAMVVFYWFADATKPGQFENVIQALICTALIKYLVDGIKSLFIWLSQWVSFGAWTDGVATAWSIGTAVVIGLGLAYSSQHDIFYGFARRLGLTSRASVGEWRFAFLRYPDRGVVLHLADGRRLMGYPQAWPADPEKGHFLLEFPTWINDDKLEPQEGVTFLMMSNKDVKWVEFLEPQGGAS